MDNTAEKRKTDDLDDKYADIPLDEHVLHMWTPLRFQASPGFDYLLDGVLGKISHFLVKIVALAILKPFNRLAFGFRIRGKENIRKVIKTGAVTICNHVHPMDCTFLFTAFWRKRMYYLTLSSNFQIPLIRHIIRIFGAIPISNNISAKQEMRQAMNSALQKGRFVQIYPEGILRPYYASLRPFQNGAFHMAYINNKPILPAVITFREPKGLYKIYKRKPCIQLTVLDPIYPNTKSQKTEEVRRLKELCRQRMQDGLSV